MKQPNIPHLDDVLLLLAAAVIVVPIFRYLKLSPVLGYLTAGAVIGPYALGSYLGYNSTDVEHLQHVAELGVIFLLFLIGLELPLERLKVMRKLVFGLGLCQVLFTALIFSGIALYMGFAFEASLVIGGALALSSTAMVLQLLSERQEMPTKHGRATFSVLLFQDLAVVPLLAITMVLGQNAEGIEAVKTLGVAFGKGILAIAIIIIFGRYFLRPLYKFFESAKNQDIFTAATLFIVLAVSTATGMLGLSMALGAFLAGMMIAGTEYRHQVEKQVMPFQGLLLGLFFMSIGMTINFKLIAHDPGLVFGLVLSLMLLKGLIVYFLARGFGIAKGCSRRTAVLLAQGGEFAFVVIKLAMDQGVVAQSDGTMVFIAVTISMVLTPVFVSVFNKLQPDESLALDAIASELKDQNQHVILVGFSRVGKAVAGMLSRENTAYVALDMDSKQVSDAKEQGLPVYYGNGCRVDLLEAIGADRARGVVISLDAPGSTRSVLKTLHQHFPDLPVIVRAVDPRDGSELLDSGATAAVEEDENISLNLGRAASALLKENTTASAA